MENLTPQQQKAIDYKGLSAVVSASAGSGKTMVLVEHITKLITDESNKVYADEIAAVTFTKKAAGELKRRLKESIEKKLNEDPQNEFYMEQAARMNYAQISTISSFCFTLIMDNIRLLPLNEGVTILDDAKVGILSKKAERLMMKRFYTEIPPDRQNEIFRYLGTEYEIIKAAKDMYKFFSNLPDPDQWKREQTDIFGDPKSFKKAFTDPYMESSDGIAETAIKAAEALDQAIKNINNVLNNDKLQKYKKDKVFSDEKKEAAAHLVIDSFEELKNDLENAVNAYQAGNYAEATEAISDDYKITINAKSKGLKEHIKAKNEATEAAKSLKNALVVMVDHESAREECFKTLKALFLVEGLYEEEFGRLKRKENGLDFSDMEKYALQAVTLGAGKGKYKYIIVDEFQDSNDIQYEIFKRLAGKKDGASRGKNEGGSSEEKGLYFVGDEKQCIYAFRNANPKIFTGLCQSPSYDNIKLTDNFRSNSYVLNTVNLLFSTNNKPKSFSENPWEDMGCGREATVCNEDASDENGGVENACGENVGIENVCDENAGGENADNENAGGENADNENAADEKVRDSNFSELVKIFPDSSKEAPELIYVAKRIKEMKESGFKIKGKEGERDCGYGDFAVLARKNKNLIKLRKIMEEMGIPAVSVGEKNFTGLMEVEQVLAMLSAVIRPHDNISVAKALMSPAYGFSAEDIAKVRMAVGVESKAGESKAPQTEASVNNAYEAENKPDPDMTIIESEEEPDEISEEELDDLFGDELEEIFYEECGEPDRYGDDPRETGSTENPASDIPDPAVGKNAGTKCLYTNLNKMNNTGAKDPLHTKIDRFLTDIKLLREEARISNTAQLIRKIYGVTALDQILSVGKKGKERLANMRLLVHYGRQYPRPADFLEAMKIAKKSELEISQAQIKEQEESSVKLMTIHASKGLQFPVVFLIDTNNRPNTRDKNDKYIYEPEKGIGIIVSDNEKLYTYNTLSHKVLENDYMDRVLGEEIRLLYVALTRAEEKLIVTSSLKKPKLKSEGDKPVADSYYEFISRRLEELTDQKQKDMMFRVIEEKPVAADEDGGENCDLNEIVKQLCGSDGEDGDISEDDFDDGEWEEDGFDDSEREEDDIYGRIRKNVAFKYPYRKLTETAAKFSATAIGVKEVKSGDENTADGSFYFGTPLFIKNYKEKEKNKKIKLTAKEKGDIYHKIMEHTNFSARSAEDELDRLVKEGLIHEGEREAVDAEEIQSFLNSDLCKRAATVGEEAVHREFPVFTTINYAGTEEPSDEDLSFIQGIADMYFAENGEIVLVDYKTNRYNRSKETIEGFANKLIKEYEGQLRIYSKALEEMTGMKVKECWLYSFSAKMAIRVEGEAGI